MGVQAHLLLGFLVLAFSVSNSFAVPLDYNVDRLNRTSFPNGFLFGGATSAYQIEGAWNVSGKGPSIWDTFTHDHPEKIADRSNADIAINSYEMYKQDVKIVKDLDLNTYRFSIAWSRVIPTGKLSGGVNEEGIQYYNNLINEVITKGLVPFVTLFHWDPPQGLEDEYMGFLSPKIVNDFRDFAELCFQRFGDRVKHWTTFNEPWTYAVNGYDFGTIAPGRCSSWKNTNCFGGNSATEPYQVTHNQLLAHGEAVKLYRQKYKPVQKGDIGITLVTQWKEPYSNSTLDIRAARRALDFFLGWYMHPVVYGDYPLTMKGLVGNRLPRFTREQSNMLRGSIDYLGLNYYTATYAQHVPVSGVNSVNISYATDNRVNAPSDRNGVPIGPPSASSWLHIYPEGMYQTLVHIKQKYRNPIIYITENGISELNEDKPSLEVALQDDHRITFYYQHLQAVVRAIKDGVNVKGFFAWSLLDNFEWNEGFTVRFGITYIDYKNGLARHPKKSAQWLKKFLLR